ncbi:hypothetical protein [Paenibacillus sp. NPDC055715]
MYEILKDTEIKKEHFSFGRKKERNFLTRNQLIIILSFIIFLYFFLDYIFKTVTPEILSFWGSIISGMISGGLTLFGVIVAFRLESNRREKLEYERIENNFTYYIVFIGEIHDLLARINSYAKYEETRTKEIYEELTEKIKMIDIKKILERYNSEKIKLDEISHILSNTVYIYYKEIDKYWDDITKCFVDSIKDAKKEKDLIFHMTKNYTSIHLAAHVLLMGLWYVNKKGEDI